MLKCELNHTIVSLINEEKPSDCSQQFREGLSRYKFLITLQRYSKQQKQGLIMKCKSFNLGNVKCRTWQKLDLEF